MYKLLLSLRYLRTRYIALASIISVMLGVATMIVVNSVMAGFSFEMRDRIHGILADVIVETTSLDGTPDAEKHMAIIKEIAGDNIEAMTATVEVYGMISFQYHDQWITRPITLVGIKPEEKAKVGPLVDYLDSYNAVREKDPDSGEMVTIRQALRSRDTLPGWELTEAAMKHRKQWAFRQQFDIGPLHRSAPPDRSTTGINGSQRPAGKSPAPNAEPWKIFENTNSTQTAQQTKTTDSKNKGVRSVATTPQDINKTAIRNAVHNPTPPPIPDLDGKKQPKLKPNGNNPGPKFDAEPSPFDNQKSPFDQPEMNGDHESPLPPHEPKYIEVDPTKPLQGRVYIGMGLISFPFEDPKTGRVKMIMMVQPGDDVKVSTVNSGRPPEAVHFNATVVDVFKSGMSEYDSTLVFCNLAHLQDMRAMVDPTTGVRAVTSIQIKLKDYNKADDVVKRLRAAFPPGLYQVRTWEQKQGPLLAAVEVESAILNVLLFLIIAVAGFGILAIFFMIVVEKTKDIGILKALGASSNGVMSIFLTYGLALGIVGSGVGVALGLLFVAKINTIESWLTWMTGRKVFDEKIYYFPEIPTLVNPAMVVWVACGAMAIAVLASILPARRASRLHPVEALRYE